MFMIFDIAILASFVSLLYHSSIHKEPYIAMCKFIFFCYLIIYRLVICSTDFYSVLYIHS